MQMAFQSVFVFLNMIPVLKPEVLIAQAKNKFNEHGQLTDTTSIDLVRQKLELLRNLVVNEKKNSNRAS
jgi:chromate reductase